MQYRDSLVIVQCRYSHLYIYILNIIEINITLLVKIEDQNK